MGLAILLFYLRLDPLQYRCSIFLPLLKRFALVLNELAKNLKVNDVIPDLFDLSEALLIHDLGHSVMAMRLSLGIFVFAKL